MAAAQSGAAVAAHGVNFVNEQNAGGVALGLFKEVADAGGADANEHLHKFAARNVKERHAGFPGHGPRQQGFAGARRPHQQHSLGDARAQLQEPLRVFEEVNHFLQLRFRLVHAGYIAECNRGPVEGHHTGPAASEAHGLVVGTLGLSHHQQDEAAEKDERQEIEQDSENAAETAGTFELHAGRGYLVQYVMLGEQAEEVGVPANAAAVLFRFAAGADPGDDGKFLAVNDNPVDLTRARLGEHFGHRKLFAASEAGNQRVKDDDDPNDDEEVDEAVANPAIVGHNVPAVGRGFTAALRRKRFLPGSRLPY